MGRRGSNRPPHRNAAAAGPPQGRALARQAALRGKRVAGLPPLTYGGHKDASGAWAAGVLAGGAGLAVPEHLREVWEERTALRVYDGKLPHAEAARLAGAGEEAG